MSKKGRGSEGKTESKVPFEERYESRWSIRRFWKNTGKLFTPAKPEFNMPKSQSCPKCGAYSRREDKTLTGANYNCRTHGKFLVLSEEMIRRTG